MIDAFVVLAVILAVGMMIVVTPRSLTGQIAQKLGHPQAVAIFITTAGNYLPLAAMTLKGIRKGAVAVRSARHG
jgi:hypothetical protein